MSHAPDARFAAAGRPSPPLIPGLAIAAIGVLVLLLALPFVGLIARVSPRTLLVRLGEPAVLEALRLSLLTSISATALVVILGTPAAYLLATREFRGKRLLEVLIQLPMVLPPTVAGFALLMAFGRMGFAGHWLSAFGVSLPFTTVGVILAQVFMAAPFFIAPARAGFAGVDPRLLDAAATLRASETQRFLRVMLPLALPSLVAGVSLSGARALGEFGATITFAGNLPGVTQTMPLAVYVALQSDLDAAVVLSVLLLVMSFGLLLGLGSAPPGWMGVRSGAGHPGSPPHR
ncbi:MAG TPA: ABC transporter permease [Candidatus Eisenbacteria bacterium]|nr:ABC transporter permease [Candidatus Eisenbacteria bacterium]